jgi:hypothetical protein
MNTKDYIELKKRVLAKIDIITKHDQKRTVVNSSKVRHSTLLDNPKYFTYIQGVPGHVNLSSYAYKIFQLLPEKDRLLFLVKLMLQCYIKSEQHSYEAYKTIKEAIEELTAI